VEVANRIHIFGASGSGTTTLGAAIADRYGYAHLDVDQYFWMPTDPPFRIQREIVARQNMLAADLDPHSRWVLTGSLCGWGDIFIPRFELAIFLLIPAQIRIARLMERERSRYGNAIAVGGPMHTHHQEFIEWARGYDDGDESIRSLRVHEKWMTKLSCKCIRLEGDLTTEDRLSRLEGLIGRINSL
jgi:adenylate kinase family enzyme